jgi:NAD(P)-dependent dehydrogenase (short-subunit alcohol dehydrogenase family)
MMAAYNASKAAITQYSETLRLELELVKVKVVTVVTGQVRTNILDNPTLDDASIYKPLEPTLQRRAKNHIGTDSYLFGTTATLYLVHVSDESNLQRRQWTPAFTHGEWSNTSLRRLQAHGSGKVPIQHYRG